MRAPLFCLLVLSVCLSCGSSEPRKRVSADQGKQPTNLKAESSRLKTELDNIAELRGLSVPEVSVSEEGIRCRVLRKGSGSRLKAGDHAVFYGQIRDLQGKVLYRFDASNPLNMELMHHPWPSLMQKPLLGMQVGEERLFALPSSYAFGLSGDGAKIGAYCSLIINFRLVGLR